MARLFLQVEGYRPCHNPEEVIADIGYDPDSDLDNPADSVFCSHGAGTIVKWDQVEQHMDLDSGLRFDAEPDADTAAPRPARSDGSPGAPGPGAAGNFRAHLWRNQAPGISAAKGAPPPQELKTVSLKEFQRPEEFLLVDGYNIIFAWDELKKLARTNLDAAREALINMLSNYQGYHKCRVIVVFDAYKVKGGTRSIERHHNIDVVYTQEAETADTYIEKASYQLGKQLPGTVATSDYTVQLIILGNHATRISASAFKKEVDQVNAEIERLLEQYRQPNQTTGFPG